VISASNRVRSLGACCLFLVLAAGCKGEEGKKPASGGGKAAAGKTTAESNGDVVISGNGAAYRVVSVASPGTVSGTVTMPQAPAAGSVIPTGKFGAMCGAGALDESIQTTGSGVANAVVWLEGIKEGKAPPDERRLELESVQCKLRPRVQAAVTGSAVNIIGHDNFMQHLQFTAGGESGSRAAVLVGGGEQVIPTELPFKEPGLVLVRDPEHAWTRAYLAVFDHPYFAVTSKDGSFTIDNVPPGKYTLRTWHERTNEAQQSVDIAPNGTVKLTVELKAK
jgi:hypothetical protein